jgi:uncharacterized protein
MPKKIDRVVIDTNLWISFLISKSFLKLDEKIQKGTVKVIFSAKLVDEFLAVRID